MIILADMRGTTLASTRCALACCNTWTPRMAASHVARPPEVALKRIQTATPEPRLRSPTQHRPLYALGAEENTIPT